MANVKINDQIYQLAPIDSVKPYPGNARRGDLEEIERSMLENGFYGAIVVQRSRGFIIRGNHSWHAAKARGLSELPMIFIECSDARARKILLVDNRANDLAHDDPVALLALLKDARDDDGLAGTGYDDQDVESLLALVAADADKDALDRDNEGTGPKGGPKLVDRFLVPPFSVLDARQGYWQTRKREWHALGIVGDAGRSDSLIFPAELEDVHVRAVEVPHGSPRFEEIRAYLKERLKASGVTQKKVNDTIGAVGMAGHYFGQSQPEIPTPEHWEALRGLLGLDSRFDQEMTWITRPPAEGAVLTHALGRKVHPLRSSVDVMPARAGQGGLSEAPAPRRVREPAARLTWTKGHKPIGKLDDVSAKINGSNRPEGSTIRAGTSMFDPVLCELMNRWFCPKGGVVLDPWAGGSTLGIVSAYLGNTFLGVELRAEQVEANERQRDRIKFPAEPPRWINADSAQLASVGLPPVDLVFTDPPYFDLEEYSGRAADGSAKATFAEFLEWYRQIIAEAAGVLKEDRFFAMKVGEVRDEKGVLRDFVGETVAAGVAAGLRPYNDFVLVTALGSLPIRTGRTFERTRKMGRTHQSVIVFVKGDPKRAADACGVIEMPGELFEEGEAGANAADQKENLAD